MDEWMVLDNLSKYYGKVKALDGVSYTSRNSQVLGLIGPNGAGKTTLIRILLGLLQRNGGICQVLGYDVWAEAKYLKRKIGVLLDNPTYPPGATVNQYFDFVQTLFGLSSKDFSVKEWSNRLALPLDRKINALSAGMKRKMGLIAAICSQAEVIIMDEPTANVDPIARNEILNLILETSKATETKFLISSHILVELEKIVDSVIVLSGGQILDEGTIFELLKKYERSNEYVCVVADPQKFISVLQTQDWVIDASLSASQVIFRTKDNEPFQVFQYVLELARNTSTPLLSISQSGSLTHIFQEGRKKDA
ncbi:MAG: ABC transporter ATP-binding protein [Promethearchaeota archaeon]